MHKYLKQLMLLETKTRKAFDQKIKDAYNSLSYVDYHFYQLHANKIKIGKFRKQFNVNTF